MAEIEHKISSPDIWCNPEAAQLIIREVKSLKSVLEPFSTYCSSISDDLGLLGLAEEQDVTLISEIAAKIQSYEQQLARLETKALFKSVDDPRNAILSIHSGAGGVDAMDWAARLQRMYQRWITSAGLEFEIVEELRGEAGVRRVVLEVRGPFAYGQLKSEVGVHRICHISEFDSSHKKQTSFASVDVVPIFDEQVVDLKESDLDITTCRSQGAGGQNVNKLETAVRIVHLPTNTMVKCQSQRSQWQNKQTALRLLASKLRHLHESKSKQLVADRYGEKADTSFGHQIRTYVLEPYQLVTDHRTGFKTSGVSAFLDGDITPAMMSFLRFNV